MLTLQTASAGSGKTYTLAKEFIRNYLFVTSPESGETRLRTEKELPEALRGILAITFTNMATEEMKQRIIEKLEALAFSEAPDSEVDYLKEFMEDTSTSRAAISRIAKAALSVLLSEYSSFNISTIDSFFQSVLRTFAYEADLNDAYQVELDSSYISKTGLDLLLEEINDRSHSNSETRYWVKHLMSRNIDTGKAWNIFSKSESSESIYQELLEVAKKMDSEEFKEVSAELEQYFSSDNDFKHFTDTLWQRYGEPLAAIGAECFSLARDISRVLKELDIINLKSANSLLRNILENAYTYRNPLSCSGKFTSFNPDKKIVVITSQGETPYSCLQECPGGERLYPLVTALLERRNEYKTLYESPSTRNWLLYAPHFPHLALMMEINRLGKEFLEANNTVQLGDTNTILKKIISDDDTPFIYERIGTRLNHYLIDEFQDTSRMQWHNLRPLLNESISRGNANLIIGDPKQSIYRFRNADPEIITRLVPETFPERNDRGNTPGENSNYRSDRNIIRFNNSVFNLFAARIDSRLKTEADSPLSFTRLYENAPQIPADKSDNGYVEIIFDPEKHESVRDYVASTFGPLVTSLLKRGYRQKEICFLTRTNEQGQQLIDGLTAYNATLPEKEQKIEFVSEQSLKISFSPAIKIIISALKAIAMGAGTTSVAKENSPETEKGDPNSLRGKNLEKISAAFSFFYARHHDLSPAACMEKFLKNNDTDDVISELLAPMQTVALPALVEAIAAKFLTEDMMRQNAPFIAAFQDLVLEYCENETADISSFLSWWSSHESSASIASPASADAVRVMTVHKAKGLEFSVVIIPFADHNYEGRKDEWRWVRPSMLPEENTDLSFPPFVPVSTNKVKDTVHEHLQSELSRLHAMDILNSVYVAFTRAKHELYIFAPLLWSKTKTCKINLSSPSSLGAVLWNIFENYSTTLPSPFDSSLFIEPDEISFSKPDPMNRISVLTSGIKPTEATIRNFHAAEKEKKAKSQSRSREVHHSGYTLNTSSPSLTFNPEQEYSAEDESVRSEGTLLHEVMQEITVSADLRRALLKMKLSGKMSAAMLESAKRIITDALAFAASDPRSQSWFDGTMRVINERAIILPAKKATGKSKVYRPDRIMISPDGIVTVVDYKFGTEADEETRKSYEHKTRRYASLLKQTGMAAQAFIPVVWYVRNNEFSFLDPL